MDKNLSENFEELSENVWYGLKPPNNLHIIPPLISARQIHIVREKLNNQDETVVERVPPPVNRLKKKSAVKFLSTTRI